MMKKPIPYKYLEKYPLQEIANEIGIDLYEWPDRHLEAAKLAAAYLLSDLKDSPATLEYGFYLGNQIKRFPGRFIPHYFLHDPRGIIIDPFCWVYTHTLPKITVTISKENYDIGGFTTRSSLGVPNPLPSFVPIDINFLSESVISRIQRELVWPQKFDAHNLSWLARQSFDDAFMGDFYSGMISNGYSNLLMKNTIIKLGLSNESISGSSRETQAIA